MDKPPAPQTKRFVIPEVVVSHFHLHEGDAIGDFGAGAGYFIEVLSKEVGDEGRVYACEIQKELVESMGNMVRNKGISNVDVLWCDMEEGEGVPVKSDTLDVVIMVNTLFLLHDKETALKEVFRTLRSGGKFFLVDWSESFGGLGPRPNQVVSQVNAQSTTEEVGFVYERSFDSGDHHYGLAFRKP